MKAVIVGGSGYIGGELLRLLLHHPDIEVIQVTSDSMAGKAVSRAHPNLRRATDLQFAPHSARVPGEVTFLATPHGESMGTMPEILSTGGVVIDLSADFRLKDPELYRTYYHKEHPHPELLKEAVFGLPELHREQLRTARVIAVPGCIATASILALKPLATAGLLDPEHVVVDAKTGSSAGGQDPGRAGLHAERSGVMRAYTAAGHRHTAEIEQETGLHVALSCHAVEAVRGILSTCHGFVNRPVDEKELWRTYRAAYRYGAVRADRARERRDPPRTRAEDPRRHQLLRHRLRDGPSREPGGRDRRDRQSHERRGRQRRSVPQRPRRVPRDHGPRVSRAAPAVEKLS